MNDLHLAALPLELERFHRWAAQRNLAGDEGNALHHLLTEVFGRRALQPFRLLVSPGALRANLYAYTRQEADHLRELGNAVAAPDLLEVVDLAYLRTKAMPREWSVGRRLAFDVRIRPVRRLARPVGRFDRRGAEVDAYLLEVLREEEATSGECSQARTREEAYVRWLSERFSGVDLDGERTRVVHLERNRAVRSGARAGEAPDVTVHGELTVNDPQAFAERLSRGVGRHAAYGYGMVLLRPPASP